jgi:1-deoxy-D-xylulose-5-phosphate reductoisomerase
MAQVGLPDMRVPIAVALAHPDRLSLEIPRLDLAAVSRLDFEEPDRERFPNLGFAYQALEGSEAAPAVLNAANEVAVAGFLAGKIPFGAIARTNGAVLEEHLGTCRGSRVEGLEDVLEADRWGRARARAALGLGDQSVTAGESA